MKVFLALFGLLVAAEAVSFFDVGLEEWNLFKLTYKKNYTSDMEDKFRLKVFLDNKHNIAKHNLRYANGLASYKLEMNQFGDMLHHEFISKINGFNKTKDMHLNAIPIGDKPTTFIEPANVALPKSVDWRTKGAVTPVKNQGQCGSCWSFSATGALEGQHFRKLGKLVSLSEQNLIDCSGKYGNDGCHGGRIDSSFQYIKDNRGIDTERAYPYEAKDDQCRYNPDQSGATDNGFVDLPEGDEQKLMAAVATVGPVSVAIDASHESFQFYHGDVYYEPECSSTRLDHGVLVVGYGTDDNGNDYWLVKNSWDTTWGDDGSQKWDFYANTGALEGQHFRKLGKLVSLSEQNLIDCSGKYGNDGCHGGRIDSSFQYIKDNRGIDTERAYPYEAKDDQCRYNPDQSGATDNGFVDLPEGDEQKLMAAVATVGPVSVAIDASHESLQFYHGDVYYEPECSSTRLDHGVLVVGYGTDDNGNDYWLVKNSWDTTWGDDGYIKMARNRDNNCGIASSASYPLV